MEYGSWWDDRGAGEHWESQYLETDLSSVPAGWEGTLAFSGLRQDKLAYPNVGIMFDYSLEGQPAAAREAGHGLHARLFRVRGRQLASSALRTFPHGVARKLAVKERLARNESQVRDGSRTSNAKGQQSRQFPDA
jgi:hypothetical protein